jgi:hypothetical protein
MKKFIAESKLLIAIVLQRREGKPKRKDACYFLKALLLFTVQNVYNQDSSSEVGDAVNIPLLLTNLPVCVAYQLLVPILCNIFCTPNQFASLLVASTS